MQRISIDTTMKQAVDENRYNNVYVGLELEGSCPSDETDLMLTALSDTFKVPKNNKSGKMMSKKSAVTNDGCQIEFTQQRDLYNEPVFNYRNSNGAVVAVYHDGSVPLEVVTRPFHIVELEKKTRNVHKTMLNRGVDMWADGKAGCHMTLVLSSHMYDSTFDEIVVKNFLQLTRMFYSDIIRGTGMGKNGKTRPTYFRQINTKGDVESLNTQKYSFVNIKKGVRSDNYKIWGIEVRAPDSTDNFDKLMETAKFFCVLLRFSAHISQYGLMRLEQEPITEQKNFSNRFLRRKCVIRKTPNFKVLMRQLRPFYKIMRLDVKKNPEEKYAKLFELMLSGVSLRDIRKQMPDEFGSLNQIQRQYVKVCGV